MDEPEGSGRLDALARDLATGAISRRTALRRFAGLTVGAILPGALFADTALANCPQSRRCDGTCCPNHAHCHHGKCKCDTGFTRCGKKCRNLQTDENNCGSCGHQCASGKVCQSGHCKAVAQCQSAADCPQAAAGSCQVATCVSGSCDFAADDTDLPADGNQCTQDLCSGGVPSNPAQPISTTCNQGGGTHCDGAGNCVAETCTDGIQNEGETDVDCGGPNCGGCANGKNCGGDTDCLSGHCCEGTCRDIQTDAGNCGSCGHVCPNGQTSLSGTCMTPCTSQSDCTGSPHGHTCMPDGYCGCRVGFADCPAASTCTSFSTPYIVNGVEYGTCV